MLRPPLADERLRLLDNGDVLLALERRWPAPAVALIDERSVIARILGHLGFPTELPSPRPGRSPPLLDEGAAP